MDNESKSRLLQARIEPTTELRLKALAQRYHVNRSWIVRELVNQQFSAEFAGGKPDLASAAAEWHRGMAIAGVRG